MDRWMDGEPRLPSSVHSFLLGSGVGSELPMLVIKPFTRRPPRFAAMTFNTSGMIRNLRTDHGWLRWAPGLGSWARLPAGVPARLGGAGGEVGPDRQAGGGRQPRRLLELPGWHSSGPMERLERTGGLMHLAGRQAGQGAEGTRLTRGQGGQAAGREAHSHHRCSRHSAGCSGHPRHCCCQHCPARRGQTPCPLRPPLGRAERMGSDTVRVPA